MSELQDNDKFLLLSLYTVLTNQFQGATFGELKVDDMTAALARAIDDHNQGDDPRNSDNWEKVPSLRDRIAIAAMQTLLTYDETTSVTYDDISYSAYEMAEDMLKERAKRLEKDNEA